MLKCFADYLIILKTRHILLLWLFVFGNGLAWGQTTRTFNQSIGSWNTANNWTPSGVPSVNDNVIFPASVTTVSSIPNTSVNSIEIQGNTGSITFQTNVNGESFLTITSSFSIQTGKTLELFRGVGQRRISLAFDINCTATINGTIEIDGRNNSTEQGVLNRGTVSMGPTGLIRNLANSAYFTLVSGATLRIGSPDGISSIGATGNIQTTARNFISDANYIYTGTENQTVGTGLPNIVSNLTIANTGVPGNQTVTLNNNRTITNDLTISSGTFNLNTYTAHGAIPGGTLTLENSTTLLVDEANNFPSNYSANILSCNSTVYYLFEGSQTVGAVNYGNLIFSGSGVKTLQTGTTQICSDFSLSGTASTTAVIGLSIGGNVTIGSGTTFTAGSYTHLVGGNWTREGTFNTGISTVNFNGANAASIQSSPFHNLTFSGSGQKTAAGNLTIYGNLTISNNFNAGTGQHNIGGNWTNNGTFTPGTSLFTFDGNTPQVISGLSPSPFFALTVNKLLNTLTASSATSVTSVLTLSAGEFNSAGNLSMISGSQIHLSTVLGSMTGSLQGTGTYDVIYQGGSRISGSELSGLGLRNVTLTSTIGSTLTLSSPLSHSGTITIPSGVTADFQSFTLSNPSLITSGTGTLRTNNTSSNPLPSGKTWSFLVNYGNTNGGQKIVFGTYTNGLTVSNSSGITTLAPISDGGSIDIGGGNFVLTGTVDPTTSMVRFTSPINQNVPGVLFYDLEFSGSGEKVFQGGCIIANLFSINSTAIARLGANNHSTQRLRINSVSQPIGTHGGSGSTATYQNPIFFGTTDTGLLNVFTVECNFGTWLGGTDSDWNLSSNWCENLVPSQSTDVIIPAIAPNQPVIGIAGGEAKNLTIESGATLTISDANTLQVTGDWVVNGTFNAGTSSLVDFGGSNHALIGEGAFANVSFTGTGTKTINSILAVSGDINPVSTAVILSGANTLTLNTDQIMEITTTGSLTTGSGKLILEPGSIYVNRSTSNPTLEIRQTLAGTKGWRMIGTPVSTSYSILTTGLETQGFPGSTNPGLQPNLLWWDETDKGTTLQGWRQPGNLSEAVQVGRGHYLYVFNGDTKTGGGNYTDILPKNLSVTGTEVNLASGIFDFGVSYTARDSNLVAQADTLIEVNQADEGFNMLANPTASPLDFHSVSGWTKTNIDESIYVWDPSSGGFLTWNGTTGDLGSGRIAPYQAFWIKANDENPALALSGNAAKSLVSTDFFGRKLDNSPPTLELNVAGEGLEAQSYITFGPEGKLGADPKDAYQLESLSEDWLLLYSFGSLQTRSPLVINHQPALSNEYRVIPLHLAASKKGEPITGSFLIDWKIPADWPATTEIVLMDHIHQKAVDMRKESVYAFNFEAPKAPESNTRKIWTGLQVPQAVVFQTPYEFSVGSEELPNLINSKITPGSKPLRPFTIFIGAFPDDRIEYLPDMPKLFSAVPNPFSEETKIRFYLPVGEKAEVVIYDMMGKAVGNFPPSDYDAGITELNWIPSAIDMGRGLYFIRLVTENYSFTQKLIKN